jgi:hypothetical protein
MRRPAALIVALAALAAGCGQGSLPPFDTNPKPPPKGAHEEFSRIGVCYNRETATPQQVIAVARANCESGTQPRLIDQDVLMTCPLSMPVRATFACLKPGMMPPS